MAQEKNASGQSGLEVCVENWAATPVQVTSTTLLCFTGGVSLDLCCAGIRTLSPSFLNSKVGIVTPNPYPMGVEHELKESMGILWRNPTPF